MAEATILAVIEQGRVSEAMGLALILVSMEEVRVTEATAAQMSLAMRGVFSLAWARAMADLVGMEQPVAAAAAAVAASMETEGVMAAPLVVATIHMEGRRSLI